MHTVRVSLASLALVFLVSAAEAQNCPFPAPTLTAPPNGATGVDLNLTLQWTATGAKMYEVWAADDGSTSFYLVAETPDNRLEVTASPDTLIEWYVVAVYDTCKNPSARFRFRTTACDSEAVALVAPPDDGTSGSPVTFRWGASDGADEYRLWIYSYTYEDFVAYYDTEETSLSVRLAPDDYAWLVETVFESCESGYSDFFYFTVPRRNDCTDPEPALVSPRDGAQQSSRIVSFSWNPVPGAIGYEVWAALDDGDFEFLGATTGTSLAEQLAYGTNWWAVIAQFNGCDDTVSDVFYVDIPYDENCDRGEPYLISPPYDAEDVPTRVDFIWTPVYGASRYRVYVYSDRWREAGISTTSRLTATVPAGSLAWFVQAEFPDCPAVWSPVSEFETSASAQCRVPEAPDLYVDPQATSQHDFLLLWLPGINTASYEIQESTQPNFTNAVTTRTTEIYTYLARRVTAPTRYYYRVRSLSSCSGLGFGPYSRPVSVLVSPAASTGSEAEAAASFGTQKSVVQTIRIPGSTFGKNAQATSFTAETDQKWLTVRPSSGVIPPEGLTLELIADPKRLPAGTSTATVVLKTTASSSHQPVQVSVNLVTPVTPSPGSGPTAQSLIIPAVAHAVGASARFESDVRLTNTASQLMKYLLNFTPTRTDGTKSGQQSTIQVEPGDTIALNDILHNFYAGGDNVQGVLEIRPLTESASASAGGTFASSRTYAITPNGTYGQFIPAIRFSDFIGKNPDGPNSILSLQQISRSAAYRTNIGLVEGSGQPATVLLTVYNDRGVKLSEITQSLRAGEHMQFPLETAVENGRLAVSVTSATGKVTAYASVLDNRTSDPLLVFPVNPGTVRAARYVVPGIANLNTPAAKWRSDIRIFNAGTTRATATLAYYPQGGNPGASGPRQVDIGAGEMRVIDSVLPSLFGVSQDSGGSVVVTTAANSSLVVTARTFNDTGAGTYGQFIPGVTLEEGVGLNEKALQLLQIEESSRFYTNVGVVELSGKPATVELSAYRPETKVAAKIQIALAPNQFIQIGRILRQFGFGTVYNARVTLKVVSGEGRVSGYASLIDTRTGDPAYIPAQKDSSSSSAEGKTSSLVRKRRDTVVQSAPEIPAGPMLPVRQSPRIP